jgi:cytochrome c556
MSRAWRGAVVMALTAGLGVVLTVNSAEKEKGPSIKAVMKHVFNTKNKQSLLVVLGNDLKTDEPDWSKVQKESKEVVRLVTPLEKATPPRGERESWEKLTASTLMKAKSLEAAAENKDKDKAQVTLKALQTSCKDCHTAHRVIKKGS